MASPANTRASLGEILKIVYEPNLNKAVVNRSLFLSGLMKKKYDGKGKQYTFATHLARNFAVSARGADDYFESAAPETVKNGTLTPAYIHIPFEINNDLMQASKGDAHAFVEGMKLVQQTSKDTLSRDMNRMAVGDGRGILATVVSASGTGTATATLVVDSTKFLEDGQLLDFWQGAASRAIRNGSLSGGISAGPWVKVSTVTDETTVVVVMSDGSNVPAIVANDVAIRKRNAYDTGAARASYEPFGLRIMADDGTLDPAGGLHGISAASYTRWKGINKDGTGYDASPALVAAMGIQFRRWSGTMFDTIWCHDNQAHALLYGQEGSYQQKRFVDAKATDLGENPEDVVINVSGQKIRIKMDLDLPEAELNFFDSKVLRYVELYGIQLLEQADGQYLTPWRDTTGQKHAQVGFWGWAGNFGTVMRNGIGRVYGLNKPGTIPW